MGRYRQYCPIARASEILGERGTVPKPGGGSTYQLTAAGRDLAAVVDQLGDWATTWVEVTHEHSDPGFALWAWCAAQLDATMLPARRTVVGFTFPRERPSNRRYWLLVERGAAELCYSYPGGPVDVEVVADSVAFVDWHRGARAWADALRSGEVVVSGAPDVARALPSWNTHDSGSFTSLAG